jgi:hypothetical protein
MERAFRTKMDGLSFRFTRATLPVFPSNPSAVFKCKLAASCRVRQVLFDVSGESEVAVLDGLQTPGDFQAQWIPQRDQSGIYYYRLQAGRCTITGKNLS